MDRTKNGGPAFPCEWDYIGTSREAANGMFIRDVFAIAALPSCIRQCVNDTRNPGETIEELFARKSYEIADAMLKARG